MAALEGWDRVVSSIRRNRAPEARFFKPVCVIAAIDLAEEGLLAPRLLNADAIINRFGAYVSLVDSSRAKSGWQPLWHLASDGLWTFSSQGQRVGPEAFAPRGLPRSRKALVAVFDRLAINDSLVPLWSTVGEREALRRQMLILLADDSDPDCRALVKPLLHATRAFEPKSWPSDQEVQRALRDWRAQLPLFETDVALDELTSDEDRKQAFLSFDLRRLPRQSPRGQKFKVGSDGPITLETEAGSPALSDQADLLKGVAIKTAKLLAALPANRNSTASLRVDVLAFSSALGQDNNIPRPQIFWTWGNTLRRCLDIDLRVRRNPDAMRESLPEDVGEMLGDLVQQFNLYAFFDERLSAFDRNSLGPKGRAEALIELEAGGRLVGAVQATTGIMDAEATDVLRLSARSAESAADQPGINADQAIANALEVQRNGVGAILRRSIMYCVRVVNEGAVREVGAQITKNVFVRFVSTNREQILSLFGDNQAGEAIRHLLRLLGLYK